MSASVGAVLGNGCNWGGRVLGAVIQPKGAGGLVIAWFVGGVEGGEVGIVRDGVTEVFDNRC